jgi:hypothetical protein
MNNNKIGASGAEEHVSLAVKLEHPLNPEQEKSLRDALLRMENEGAVASFGIEHNEVSVCYDPTKTSEKELTQLISWADGEAGDKEVQWTPYV